MRPATVFLFYALITIFNFNGAEAAFCCAKAAFEAFFLIDFKRLLNLARRRFSLADTVAHRTALTFFGDNRYLFNSSESIGSADSAYRADVGALRTFNALCFVNFIKRSVVIGRVY